MVVYNEGKSYQDNVASISDQEIHPELYVDETPTPVNGRSSNTNLVENSGNNEPNDFDITSGQGNNGGTSHQELDSEEQIMAQIAQ